jgi:excisionase family DNA binding protein
VELREAAYRLGVSERTLRQWIKDGKLVGKMTITEHGRQWEIPESALLD